MTEPRPDILGPPYDSLDAPPTQPGRRPRILIVKRGGLGDILMVTPLLAGLTAAYPDAALTWMAGADTFELLAGRPDLAEVLVWDADWWRRLSREQGQAAYLRARLRFMRGLRARRFDLLLSLEGHQMWWLPWATGAPRRIGLYARGPAALGYHQVRNSHGGILAALGWPEPPRALTLPLLSEDYAAADALLTELAPGSGPLVVVHPFTNWVTKTWPAGHFIAVMDRLAETHGARFVLTGAAWQRQEAQEIAAACRRAAPLVVAGRTPNIRHLGALIARCGLLLTGDTGAMHIGGAVGATVLAIFGATPASAYLPPPPANCVSLADPPPCGPCHRKVCANAGQPLLCLHRITVERVLDAVEPLLKETHELSPTR